MDSTRHHEVSSLPFVRCSLNYIPSRRRRATKAHRNCLKPPVGDTKPSSSARPSSTSSMDDLDDFDRRLLGLPLEGQMARQRPVRVVGDASHHFRPFVPPPPPMMSSSPQSSPSVLRSSPSNRYTLQRDLRCLRSTFSESQSVHEAFSASRRDTEASSPHTENPRRITEVVSCDAGRFAPRKIRQLVPKPK